MDAAECENKATERSEYTCDTWLVTGDTCQPINGSRVILLAFTNRGSWISVQADKARSGVSVYHHQCI